VNIHTPERQPGETQDAYRARRVASRSEARRITTNLGPSTLPQKQRPARRQQRGLPGQNPKFAPVRVHKPKAAIKPTWPKTDDQKRQSRPVIYAAPVRALIAHKFDPEDRFCRAANSLRSDCSRDPKWHLDRVAAYTA